MQLNRVSCHWTINDMLLNHTSFYRTIFLMSLDRTSFYWIIRHSIGSYTSCHWIRLHFIGSYVYLLDRIFYVIGSGFMSLQHIILSGNHICVIGSIFMSLDCRPFDRTIHVMPLDRTSCHWIRNVIPSGQRLIERCFSPRIPECLQNAFQIIFPRGCSSLAVLCCVESLAEDGQLNEKNGDFTP